MKPVPRSPERSTAASRSPASCQRSLHSSNSCYPVKNQHLSTHGVGRGVVCSTSLNGGESAGNRSEVIEALQKAAEAMNAAEDAVTKVHTLPSAHEPTPIEKGPRKLSPLLTGVLLLGYCVAIHSFQSNLVKLVGGLILVLGVASSGYRKGSLSASGALAAILVGWATVAPSFRAGLVLLAFFFSSSKLTKLGDYEKGSFDEDHKVGGQRDWKQVACNGLVPAVLTVAAGVLSGARDMVVFPASFNPTLTALYAAFLGYYSCCCGDTWASEIGPLSSEEPRLVTTLRPVRKGTNGGVTLVGLLASAGGGLFIGGVFYLMGLLSPTAPSTSINVAQWKVVLLGLGAGLVGSLIDSVLGATIQFTGYNRDTGKITGRPGPNVTWISGFPLLDNNAVNVVSASLTAGLTAAVAFFC